MRSCAFRDARSLWQGPSPLPQRCAGPCPAGGQSPRPAPDPPMAGASPPPGRALACVVPGPTDLQGTVPRGRGKRAAFPDPPGGVKALSPLLLQGPSPLPQRHAAPWPARGHRDPDHRRPAPGGRFAPAGPGAGLSLFPDLPVHRAPSCAGGETRVAFPDPARNGPPFLRIGKIAPPGRGWGRFFQHPVRAAMFQRNFCGREDAAPLPSPERLVGLIACRLSLYDRADQPG